MIDKPKIGDYFVWRREVPNKRSEIIKQVTRVEKHKKRVWLIAYNTKTKDNVLCAIQRNKDGRWYLTDSSILRYSDIRKKQTKRQKELRKRYNKIETNNLDSNFNHPGCYKLTDPTSGVFVLGTYFNLQMAKNHHVPHISRFGLIFKPILVCSNEDRTNYYHKLIATLKRKPNYTEMINEYFPVKLLSKFADDAWK